MNLELDAGARGYCAKIFDTVRALSADGPGVTRQGYGPVETNTIEFLRAEGESLGLQIETDAAGNVWMRLPGRDRSLPAFVAGSHADSVPQGGNFDGLAGITAALCAARQMKKTGFVPQRDFVVLVMRCEESSFFGKSYIGSLAFTGKLKPADIALKHRTADMTLADSMRECGCEPEALVQGKPLADLSKIAAFVELHIEQGPSLDASKDARVGVVTGIRGNIRHKAVKCLGETAHSGAVDKPYRHDAVLAAADLLHRMDLAWDRRLEKGDDLVFTVGVLKTAPTAAISVIPGEASFTVDIRSLHEETYWGFHEELLAAAKAVGEERGVRFTFDDAIETLPGHVDAQLTDRVEAAAKAAGVPVRRLASGAGHDAAVISAAGVPAAMIFVANQNGSHNPREAMRLEDFLEGVKVLWSLAATFDA